MNHVKLIVLVLVVLVKAVVKSSEYCKICPDHTLCKYPVAGPSETCIDYDLSALLTRDDIIDIVHRINERRNSIALGLNKRLPTAANMRKISWSEDLAWSAQRWVDQCDPSLRPDKHDQCRNLTDKAVGQTIATIFGLSPGLSVKSWVDIWFMQTLDYRESVTYYNQSDDAKTNHFTQLIWAETNSVGCGKAKFYLKRAATVVERLVCNFAPSGNIHGKPIYAVGYPATQCPDSFTPDDTYTGLCTQQSQVNILTTPIQAVSSFLRILNHTNSSEKLEIDPLRDNLKHPKIHGDDNDDDHRHQKLRHVVNSSQVGVSHFSPLTQQNKSRKFLVHHYSQKRSSKAHRGQEQRDTFIPPYTTGTTVKHFKGFTKLSSPSVGSDTRQKSSQENKCTRYSQVIDNCDFQQQRVTKQCTRVNNDCDDKTAVSSPPSSATIAGTAAACNPCRCYSSIQANSSPKDTKSNGKTRNETQVSTDLHYYDLFPYFGMRSSETLSNKRNEFANRKVWLSSNRTLHNERNKILKENRRKHHPKKSNHVTQRFEFANYMNLNEQNDSRKRNKRQTTRQLAEYENDSRMLRNKCKRKREGQYINPLMSYGELYFFVVKKLRKLWENKHNFKSCEKCPCNKGLTSPVQTLMYVIVLLLTLHN